MTIDPVRFEPTGRCPSAQQVATRHLPLSLLIGHRYVETSRQPTRLRPSRENLTAAAVSVIAGERTLGGWARVSTEQQDLTAQPNGRRTVGALESLWDLGLDQRLDVAESPLQQGRVD